MRVSCIYAPEKFVRRKRVRSSCTALTQTNTERCDIWENIGLPRQALILPQWADKFARRLFFGRRIRLCKFSS